jgi:thiamine-monophosphate kinase
MQFANWGEDSFLETIANLFLSPKGIVGIGDDAAVIPQGNGNSLLVTCDALVEGVHFLKEKIPPHDLGYKTIAVNVSDIAAMGGAPKYAFLTIAIPKTTATSFASEVMKGIKEGCETYGLSLLGGDTVGSMHDLFLNLTLIGTAKNGFIKYRNGAKDGDIVVVTNYLGDSGCGLKTILENFSLTSDIETLQKAHYRPTPSPAQGTWLASHHDVHAMMDISDGLDCDLKRLLKSSQKGASIEISSLPLSPPLLRFCKRNKYDPIPFALTGGEDYSLLFTVAPQGLNTLCEGFKKRFDSELYPIGHITQEEGISYYKDGEKLSLELTPFNHFNMSSPP